MASGRLATPSGGSPLLSVFGPFAGSGLSAKHQSGAKCNQGEASALCETQRLFEIDRGDTMSVITSWIVLSSAGE
jgi:hypothetical protein